MEHNLREAGFFGTMEPEQMTANTAVRFMYIMKVFCVPGAGN